MDPTDELWRSLRNDVMRRGADLHTAEDIVQETWLRAVRRPPQDRGRFRGWLHVVATRCLRQVRESQRLRSEHLIAVAREDCALPAEEAAEPTALERLVDELPELYRDVVRQRFLEDRSVEEIAARTGRSQETVRTQLKRGLRRLRARLGADHRRRTGAWFGLGWLAGHSLQRSRGKMLTASGAVALAGVAVLALDGPGGRPLPELPLADLPHAPRRPSDAVAAAGVELPGRVSVTGERVARADDHVTGIVRAPNGEPAPGATVHAASSDEFRPAIETETDARGRYNIAAGRHDVVWATHPDFRPSNRCYVGSSAVGGKLVLDLVRPAASIDYVVQTADGEPVVGAEVVTVQQFGLLEVASLRETLQFVGPDIAAVTDGEGRARVHVPSMSFELLVQVDGEPVWSRVMSVQEAVRTTVVTLPRPGTLYGVVVGTTGAPAPRASVELLQLEGRLRRQADTETDGTFRLAGLSPGPFVLRVLEDPSSGTTSARREGELAVGERIDVGEIALGEQSTIHGRVLRDSQPVAGVGVTLRTENGDPTEGGHLRTTTTDQDGRYAFGGCRTWPIYTVFTTPAAGAFHGDAAPARPGRAPIDLAHEIGPTAPVVVEFTGNAPLLIEIRRTPLASMVLAPALGTHVFRSESVPAGSYELLAWLPELGTWHCGTIVHDPLGQVVHTFEAPGGAQISVELDFPDGFPQRRGAVALLVPGFGAYGKSGLGAVAAHMQLAWDEDQGAFTGIVAPQTYYASSSVAGSVSTSTSVVIEDGRDHRLVLRQAPGVPMRLVFSGPRPLTLGEVIGLEFVTPRGTIHFALHWTDQIEHESGLAFSVDVPLATSEIRALSVPRPAAGVAALRSVRSVLPEELEDEELLLVLE
jgi:RNA polymerase sigma factor (sigma-70 family)